MKIIAFSARKQGGKTTCAKAVLRKYGLSSAHVLSFATALKGIVDQCFVPVGTTIDFDSNKDKNIVLPCGFSVREMLQKVGTDWFRNTFPEVWITCLEKQLASMWVKQVVITDVRFLNEVQWVHSKNGVVIRLLRAPFADIDQHSSETALDDCKEFDAVVDNCSQTIEENIDAVLAIIEKNKWF